MSAHFPTSAPARDRFVLDRREPRPDHDPWRYQDLVVEDERTAGGSVARTAVLVLTGRECPWRCVMCDLWRSTIPGDTPAGAIPAQVAAARHALDGRHERIAQMKLYNAASFFDPRAVPTDDYDAIASHLTGLARVIVESHPSLVASHVSRVDRFLDALDRHGDRDRQRPALEVAMGLETAHPESLERLNKRMSVEGFARAARCLAERHVALRVFLLIRPPFVPSEEQDEWMMRSADVAFACGASVVSLIPTRSGNGAMEALATAGDFHAPLLAEIERSVERALARRPERGRLFVDLWDLERCSTCQRCFEGRRARLHAMNLEQRILPPVPCAHCGAAKDAT